MFEQIQDSCSYVLCQWYRDGFDFFHYIVGVQHHQINKQCKWVYFITIPLYDYDYSSNTSPCNRVLSGGFWLDGTDEF